MTQSSAASPILDHQFGRSRMRIGSELAIADPWFLGPCSAVPRYPPPGFAARSDTWRARGGLPACAPEAHRRKGSG